MLSHLTCTFHHLCHLVCSQWDTFVSLQSVTGGDLELPQVTEGVAGLLSGVRDELKVELSLYDITRTGSPCNNDVGMCCMFGCLLVY